MVKSSLLLRASLFLFSCATSGLVDAQTTTAPAPATNMPPPTPTLLEKMVQAQDRLSPACVTALKGLNADNILRVNFASGNVVDGLNILFKSGGDVGKIVEGGLPSTFGQPDMCTGVKELHYCQVTIKEAFIRWGACVPSQCQGDDMVNALLPPGFETLKKSMDVQAECADPDFHKPTTGTWVMLALTALLAALALAGTWIEQNEKQQRQQVQVALPTKLVHEETKSEPENG